MNKKELATVVVLILLIPVVMIIDQRFFQSPPPDAPLPSEMADDADTETDAVATPRATPRATPEPSVIAPADADDTDAPPAIGEVEPTEFEDPPPEAPDVEPRTLTLANDLVSLEVGNFGAGVHRVELKGYPATIQDNQAKKNEDPWEPIRFDFSKSPALVYQSSGLNARAPFEMEALDAGRTVRFTREIAPGIHFQREMRLEDDYTVRVVDSFTNHTDVETAIQELPLWLGPMYPLENVSQKFGPFLGVDAFHTAGIGVKHYLKDIRKAVRNYEGVYEKSVDAGLDWFTVKNKFFTQVLTIQSGDHPGGRGLSIRASAGDDDAQIGMIQSGVRLGSDIIQPGATMSREFQYYVGPMLSGNLKELGMGQDAMIDVRLWRIFVPIGKLMLNGLNGLYGVVGNWGVAIILLTVVVRMLFWPLTAKGAENMKKMSELSPQIKEIKEKYKSNPQKMNQAMGQFYKENKVNPMAGCLPMVVQIPVFFSLYGVLRIAVELRFAEFLWVRDLSEPENLFLLFGFPVNILPLTMGATMILQQRMTPSTMDEQQRKIMMMMPIVFLFITYGMPSGLLLYWTTSNIISIYQSWHTRRKQARKGDATPAVAQSKPGAGQLQKRKPQGNAQGKNKKK
ncbi:MAG: membrane protein insertase YidC [Verrucomicrobia bacterium]|nr:membrane protein insertase YidC [Verrucomicrobiota bacterium]MCH8510064.1 membrane protein insertase YidC [Kiritimatiellia bacterium]